jgi:hypothetical protein
MSGRHTEMKPTIGYFLNRAIPVGQRVRALKAYLAQNRHTLLLEELDRCPRVNDHRLFQYAALLAAAEQQATRNSSAA